ncbi:arginine/serine-rich protein PNISR-like [Penaeus indicus]|uniref:arginine/serine-rich protein PNISR-like n=1 Tax=Penaeus indicus TaxID=29960 RepID=UPI00300C312A
MWSGAPQWASWALQPQHYQNMKPEEASTVDWAELAKQWIQMKETAPQEQTQPPQEQSHPSQPVASSGPAPQVHPPEDAAAAGGGGEMDMEIEDDKGPAANGSDQQNGESWGSWNGEGNWPPTHTTGMGWGWGWPVDAYSQSSTANQDINAQQHYSGKDGEYGWPIVGTEGVQGEYGRNDRRDRRGREFQVGPTYPDRMVGKEADFQLDAAQRKKLPAWIREGLEKMEREKQRKLEKERQMSEKEEMLKRKREEEARARRILEEDLANDGKPRVPRKSKFDSDSDMSDHSRSASPETATTGLGMARKRRSRFAPQNSQGGAEEDGGSREETEEKEEEVKISRRMPSPEPAKSEEEKMQEMMLKLRRWMTEILLDVTTEMMEEVASEVLNRARMKGTPFTGVSCVGRVVSTVALHCRA